MRKEGVPLPHHRLQTGWCFSGAPPFALLVAASPVYIAAAISRLYCSIACARSAGLTCWKGAGQGVGVVRAAVMANRVGRGDGAGGRGRFGGVPTHLAGDGVRAQLAAKKENMGLRAVK